MSDLYEELFRIAKLLEPPWKQYGRDNECSIFPSEQVPKNMWYIMNPYYGAPLEDGQRPRRLMIIHPDIWALLQRQAAEQFPDLTEQDLIDMFCWKGEQEFNKRHERK